MAEEYCRSAEEPESSRQKNKALEQDLLQVREEDCIYQEESRLAFYDCDYLKRMKLSTILKITAQLAGQDYTRRGFGHSFLWEHGYVFLLSRVSLRIHWYPTEPMTLISRTWECGNSGAMFLRAYEILADGQLAVEGVSAWILVEPNSRKIIRPKEFPWKMPQLEHRTPRVLPVTSHRLELSTQVESMELPVQGKWNQLTRADRRLIRLSDLDANGHVYNAMYADMAEDIFSLEEYSRDIMDFRINFISEARYGDELILFRQDQGAMTLVEGQIQGVNSFQCLYHWKE